MSNAWRRGGTTRWQKFRLAILQRDKWLCTIGEKGCTIKANHVDHIIPLGMGGEQFDPGNCRASCEHCNLTRKKSGTDYKPPHKVISTW